ncbi:UvrD-helicase domain-containing protein [Methanococcoides methylutens]|uniref:UvrD-helicase domain-containing protein n=1 Tax=Methanococcoides methylutens TaxID=2226 RepID=UPI0040447DA4
MALNIMQVDQSELTAGEKKVANKIKQIYKDATWNAYLYYQPRIKKWNPDFILIDDYKGVSIIEVKDWSLEYIDEINPLSAVVNGKTRHNPIYVTNQYFNAAKSRLQNQAALIDDKHELKYGLYSNLVLPNIKSHELEEYEECFFQPPSNCITSENITDLTIDDLFSEKVEYINKYDFAVIRSTFFPEIKVKTVQKELWEYGRKNATENSIIKTLDTEQEKFARRIPYGHYMISGIPGSGKTVILLARAVHLARENPNWKIKILTYNASLTTKLNHKLESIQEDLHIMGVNYQNIEISTFHSLAISVADIGIVPDPAPDNYWEIIVPYKAIEKAHPTYDAILIDEYQDFHDSWMKLCLLLCKKHDHNGQQTENLFLAGDRLQSIYNPSNHNWKSLGINIVGRSKLLKTSYRSGSTHVNLALDYLMKNPSTKREVENFYEGRDGICCDFDIDNNLEFIKGSSKVINDLLEDLLKNPQYNPSDILVLLPNNKLRNNMYQMMSKEVKSNSVASKHLDENKMNFVTYHSAKGIEAKVCVLIDVDKVKDKKLLYVGMTRAFEKLIIHSPDSSGGPVFNEVLECYGQMTGEKSFIVEKEKLTKPMEPPKKTKSGQKKYSLDDIRAEHSNAYKKWNSSEESELIKMFAYGEKIDKIAVNLGRQESGIKARLKKLGLIK